MKLEDLQNSACATRKENQHLWEKPKHRKPRRPSKHVLWMKEQLQAWCERKGYELKEEHKFSEYRKFRFDFAIKELKIGIEYNGIQSDKSRHTTLKGYTGDMEKINLAQSEGYKVLQFTVLNYQKLIEIIEAAL